MQPVQPAMNEYKNPRPNPRGPKHHIGCRQCYLFTLQYFLTSRGVKLLSKPIIIYDRIKYKVCYLIRYIILYSAYHGVIIADPTSENPYPASKYNQHVGLEDRPASTLHNLLKPGQSNQRIHGQLILLRPAGLQGR